MQYYTLTSLFPEIWIILIINYNFGRIKEQVRLEQINVTQQREQLYPKLQILTNQGIIVSSNMKPSPASASKVQIK